MDCSATPNSRPSAAPHRPIQPCILRSHLRKVARLGRGLAGAEVRGGLWLPGCKAAATGFTQAYAAWRERNDNSVTLVLDVALVALAPLRSMWVARTSAA